MIGFTLFVYYVPIGAVGTNVNRSIMSKISKVVVTIVVVVVSFLLFGVIVGVRESAGYTTPGPLGLIIMLGAYGAIRAVWKKGDKKDDNSTLQK